MLQVVGHRLLIKPDPFEKMSKGGILLAQDERAARQATMKGEVLQIGETAWMGFADNQPWCQVGDKIIYARHAGKFVVDPETDEELYVINDEDVQVIVTKEKE